jgi:hypothetical protein
MNHKNLKSLEKSGAVLPGGVPTPGLYLLSLIGDGIDIEKLRNLVETVPHFQIAPLCWILLPPSQGIREFADSASLALASEGSKAEVLLCHLSASAIFHVTGGGLGLAAWLEKMRYLKP